MAQFQAHRATLDHEGIARSRADAADHALFDAGRDANLARRYEAAALRMVFRALNEFRIVEAAGFLPAVEDPAVLDSPSLIRDRGDRGGDGIVIADPADPADPAEQPLPERRSFERRPLASFGITVEQASREFSQPHYSRPPVPFDQPVPPIASTQATGWRR